MWKIWRKWLEVTDAFIYGIICNTFNETEKRCQALGCVRDVTKELERFAREPLTCAIGTRSKFQTYIKLRIKAMIGFFFVVLPLGVFMAVAHASGVHLVYALFATVVVAFFGASRVEETAIRYVRERMA